MCIVSVVYCTSTTYASFKCVYPWTPSSNEHMSSCLVLFLLMVCVSRVLFTIVFTISLLVTTLSPCLYVPIAYWCIRVSEMGHQWISLSPFRCQANDWTNCNSLLMCSLRANLNEIRIEKQYLSFRNAFYYIACKATASYFLHASMY